MIMIRRLKEKKIHLIDLVEDLVVMDIMRLLDMAN